MPRQVFPNNLDKGNKTPPCLCLTWGYNISPMGNDSREQLFLDSYFWTQAQRYRVVHSQQNKQDCLITCTKRNLQTFGRGITEQLFPYEVANAPRSISTRDMPSSSLLPEVVNEAALHELFLCACSWPPT